MKKDIHPKNYRFVIFKDISNDESFLGRSCANTKDKAVWEDGNEYPLIKMEISAMSHPFFTGKMKFVDTAGRIDKFNKKFSKTSFVSKEVAAK
jgi:large subunit ribosomal protein L31